MKVYAILRNREIDGQRIVCIFDKLDAIENIMKQLDDPINYKIEAHDLR